jgi:uncharacterized protein DUF4199
MKKIALTFGLIGSALILVYFFITFLILGDPAKMNADTLSIAEVFGYLRYLILLLTVIFAMRAYKQQATASLSYWSIVKAGIVVSLIVGAMVGLMEMIYIALTPEFFDGYYNAYIEAMIKKGASATEIAAFKDTFERLSWMRNPLLTCLFYFVETALIGLVMSFIIGIFMRSKPQPKLA